jgi:hypothetical protein
MSGAEDGVKIADSPEDEGLYFANESLKGSGTIRRDGTYGPPTPDPTVLRGLGPDRTSGGRLVPSGEGHALYGEEAEANLTDDEKKTLAADAKGLGFEPQAEEPAAAPAKRTSAKA